MIEAVKNYLTPSASDWLWSGDADDMIALHDNFGRISKVSDSVRNILGISPGELAGRPLTDILFPADRGVVLDLISRASSHGIKGRSDVRLIRADGTIAWTEMTVSTDPQGRIRTITRDISERQERDRHEAEARQKAEAEVESRTNYLADLSHEIRTPLSAVIGFADMMRSETFGPVGHEKYGEYAELIHKSGQHMLSLVSDLLDAAKIEAGKFVLYPEPVKLRSLVQDCIEISRLGAEEAGLWLKADLPEELPTLILDPKATRQMLLNLLSNAIKFTRTGGVTVRLRFDEGNIWISIIDTGIGISASALEHIGERFQQAHGESVRGTKGTGLGLALTNALAELHNGELRLTSEEGHGTKAVVHLPRIDAEVEQTDNIVTERAQEDAARSAVRSVVDDNAFERLTRELTNSISGQKKAS